MATSPVTLLFAPVAKVALDSLESVLGDACQGLGAAANLVAKDNVASSPSRRRKVNKLTKMARDLNASYAMERHFTKVGTTKWLGTFNKLIHELYGADGREETVSESSIDIVSCTSSSMTEATPCLPTKLQLLEQRLVMLEQKIATDYSSHFFIGDEDELDKWLYHTPQSTSVAVQASESLDSLTSYQCSQTELTIPSEAVLVQCSPPPRSAIHADATTQYEAEMVNSIASSQVQLATFDVDAEDIFESKAADKDSGCSHIDPVSLLLPPPNEEPPVISDQKPVHEVPAPPGSRTMLKYKVGIEQDDDFNLMRRLLVPSGGHIKRISQISCAKLTIRGQGSGLSEADEPINICIYSAYTSSLESAKYEVVKLLGQLHEEYRSYCCQSKLPAPTLNIPPGETFNW